MIESASHVNVYKDKTLSKSYNTMPLRVSYIGESLGRGKNDGLKNKHVRSFAMGKMHKIK